MKQVSELQGKIMMQKTPLVSIIVPVYQVKEYISECVESLLAQTYTNLEILLVDDGSTDGSGEICDEYAAKDSRVRVVHQGNQGPSAARNTGLDYAKGEFVAFVDSDDVALPDFITTLYNLAEVDKADIAACAYMECGPDIPGNIREGLLCRDASEALCAGQDENRARHWERHHSDQEIYMTSEQMLRQWHGRYKKWETVVWNKLYRKHVFGGGESDTIRFPVGRKLEDVLISHLLVANAKQIVLTMHKLYLYRIRPDSRASQSRMTGLMRENLRAQRERLTFFREKRYWRAYLNLLWGYVLHLGWFGWKRMKGKKQSGSDPEVKG